MKLIPLTRGLFAVVDDEDFEYYAQWKWHAKEDANTSYACRGDYSSGKLKIVRMHRQLMDAKQGMDVDHINGDGLDNRRANLRVCTRRENLQNQGVKRGLTSRFKGVYWMKQNQKWRAKITLAGRQKCLGLYVDEAMAAAAYNSAAKKHFGEFARINSL